MDARFEKMLETVKKYFPVPGGFALAVKDGKTVIYEAFGVENTETGKPVDDTTFFTLASASKAFATCIIAMLCDDGLLDWDKPVKSFWPDFYFVDDYITENITLADMLSQRSGFASHNLIRINPEIKPFDDEYVRRILKLPLAGEFRNKVIYQNELYRVAGYIMKLVTGKEFEQLVRERIAAPLGMDIAFKGEPVPEGFVLADGYRAEGMDVVPCSKNEVMGLNNPCGGVRTNLRSMTKWMKFWANNGCLPDGTRLLSEKQCIRVRKPVLFWSYPAKPDQNRFYALGWAPSVYRGHRRVYHGGVNAGYNANVSFYPDDAAAVAVVLNIGGLGQQQVTALNYMLTDLLLDAREDSYEPMLQRWYDAAAAKKAAPEPEEILPPKELLEKIKGTWYNEAYGNITASERNGMLLLNYYDKAVGTVSYKEGNTFYNGFCGYPAELIFDDDGKHAVMSFTEGFSPTKFEKI